MELLRELIAQRQPLDILRRTCCFKFASAEEPDRTRSRIPVFHPFAEMEGSGEGQAGLEEGKHRLCKALSPLHSLCLPSCVSSTCCSARDPTLKHRETALFEEEKGMKKGPDHCEPPCFHSPT